MANKTYVALLTGGNDIKWVTGLDNETRTAYWEAEKPARPFTKRLAEDLAAMLRCNGHPAVTISAPNWRSFENDADWFGEVRWCDDDIRVALEDCGIEDAEIRAHEDMVDEIHVRLENHHALADLMVETGWEILHHVIHDYLREREEGHDRYLIPGIDDIDEDCIRHLENLLGRPVKTYDEYKEIDGQMDDMILDYDTREEWLAAYPALAKYVKI